MKIMLSNDSISKLSRLETFNELVDFIKSIKPEDDIPEGYCDIVAEYEKYLDECEEMIVSLWII